MIDHQESYDRITAERDSALAEIKKRDEREIRHSILFFTAVLVLSSIGGAASFYKASHSIWDAIGVVLLCATWGVYGFLLSAWWRRR
jgi:hypothetical protein